MFCVCISWLVERGRGGAGSDHAVTAEEAEAWHPILCIVISRGPSPTSSARHGCGHCARIYTVSWVDEPPLLHSQVIDNW